MILTVTLNPAVDKTCSIQELLLGQVNRLKYVQSIAGGKGVNVTRVLRQFDYPVTAMGFLGGYSGRLIEDTLKDMGVNCCFTWIKQETRVSTNILAEDGCVTEILEPGPEITKEELSAFLEEYRKQLPACEWIVISGSIPKGVPADIYGKLIQWAKEQDKKVLLDTSGEPLRLAAEAGPYLVKPNQKELESLVGRKLETIEEIQMEAERLLTEGIEKIVVSLGQKGLLYVDASGSIFQKAYPVTAVNTVACGDTVVASYCMSEISGVSREIAVRNAAAMAAANATTEVSARIPIEVYEKIREKVF